MGNAQKNKLQLAEWYRQLFEEKYIHDVQNLRSRDGFNWNSVVKYGVQFLAEALKEVEPGLKEKLYEEAELCKLSDYSGWGYSSFFFAYPEKVIGTMKTTGSFMFPVTVEGTREDVINYFKRKLEDEEEDDMKGAEERLRHLRMLRLKAKAVKLSLELVKYSEEPDGVENDEEFKGKVLEFIRKSLSNGRFSINFDCTKLVSDETRTKIYRCNGWTVANLEIPSHSIRHIHNRHGETFERPRRLPENPGCG